jgi:muramoyltetrapeptide carboxypeptidase
MRIAVVAPSCTLKPEAAELVLALAAARPGCELLIHPQCFLTDGHFAGSDDQRLGALREVMADDSVDAIWFARGGYGANRIAEAACAELGAAARGKTYLGYSDAGFLLAGLRGGARADAAGRASRRRRGGGGALARLAADPRSKRAGGRPQLSRPGL